MTDTKVSHQPREWEAFCKEHKGNFVNIKDTRRIVRMLGCPEEDIVTLRLVEDPDGAYMGWLPAGKEQITLVQPENAFPVQFIYGYKEEEKRGKGEAVRLRLERA